MPCLDERVAASADLQPVRPAVRATPGDRFLLAAAGAPQPLFDGLCAALRARGYSAACLAQARPEQLAQAFREREVQLLVLHLDPGDGIDVTALLDLRRRFPAIDWVLAGRTRWRRWAELLVRFQARGYIDCDDPASLHRAAETLAAGGLWLPRWLMSDLYDTLLRVVQESRVDVAGPAGEFAGGLLTPREGEALELMRKGLTNKEIATRLNVSINTVKKHLKNAFDKRGLHSRRQGFG